MQRAIESAHVAQSEYFASTTAAARGKILQKWHDLVMENIDDCLHPLPTSPSPAELAATSPHTHTHTHTHANK
jgi:hypothetical protein